MCDVWLTVVFFKQKTAYEMRISDVSSDVCSSDLNSAANRVRMGRPGAAGAGRDRFGLTGSSQVFDPRVVAIRPDLADIAVAGTHFAPHYAAPMMRSGVLPAAALRASPSLDEIGRAHV